MLQMATDKVGADLDGMLAQFSSHGHLNPTMAGQDFLHDHSNGLKVPRLLRRKMIVWVDVTVAELEVSCQGVTYRDLRGQLRGSLELPVKSACVPQYQAGVRKYLTNRRQCHSLIRIASTHDTVIMYRLPR